MKLIIFFFMNFIWSQAYGCPTDKLEILDLGTLDKIAQPETHFAATGEEIENAPCRRRRSLSDIESHINQLQNSPDKESLDFRGLSLVDQNPELLESFVDLVTRREILGTPLPDDQQPDLSTVSHCRDVLCATRGIFGPRVGPKLLFMRQNFGMNGSDLAYENASRLRPAEINSFIRSLDDMPTHLLPMQRNRRMTHSTRGYAPNDTVIANATMNFFDRWSAHKSEGDLDYVCTHELGHVVAGELELDSHPDWLRLSGWEDLGDNTWEATQRDVFVSGYGMSNPGEDFAESVSAYRYNPEALIALSPEKYEFIKTNVYAGVEYRNQISCQVVPPPLLNRFKNALSQTQLTVDHDEIRQRCFVSQAREFHQASRQAHPITLEQCIVQELSAPVIEQFSDLTELERRSLLRHVSWTFTNAPELAIFPHQTRVEEVASFMREELRNDIVDGLVNSSSYTLEVMNQGDCEESSNPYLLDFSSIGQLTESASWRVSDLRGDVWRNYCSFHQEHRTGAETIERLDALYFVSQLTTEPQPRVDELFRERLEVQAQLQNNPELSERLSSIEQELRQLLGRSQP